MSMGRSAQHQQAPLQAVEVVCINMSIGHSLLQPDDNQTVFFFDRKFASLESRPRSIAFQASSASH